MELLAVMRVLTHTQYLLLPGSVLHSWVNYYFHFVHEAAKAQKGDITCSRSHSNDAWQAQRRHCLDSNGAQAGRQSKESLGRPIHALESLYRWGIWSPGEGPSPGHTARVSFRESSSADAHPSQDSLKWRVSLHREKVIVTVNHRWSLSIDSL